MLILVGGIRGSWNLRQEAEKEAIVIIRRKREFSYMEKAKLYKVKELEGEGMDWICS